MGSGVSVTIMVGKTMTITMMLMVRTVMMKMMTVMIPVIIGSLSNYDDDDDNLKKTTGLMIKTTALHVHHAFLVNFFDFHCTTTT